MEFMTKPQEKELNNLAKIFANEQAKSKGGFPKRHFTPKDVAKMIGNRKRIAPTLISLVKTAGVIKKHDVKRQYKTKITRDEFELLRNYILNDMDMDSFGVAYFEAHEIYAGMGIPYQNVLVLTRHMNKTPFDLPKLPNMDCMLEVMKVYGDTGVAALGVTDFLRQRNFGAIPNHSLGGNVDYTKAGYKANLGFIGKSGLLITPQSGACTRISIVYTSIENLGDFLENNEDFSWGRDFCDKCGRCVKTCPYGAIYTQDKVDDHGNVEAISYPKCGSGFAHYGCGICIAACPFTTVGYGQIREKFIVQHSNEKTRQS